MKGRQTSSCLRHRLTLQEEVQTPDDGGGYTRTWNDVAELWAEIMPLSGREYLSGHQLEASVTHRILLRYRSDVVAGQRLVFESRAFNIRAVINTGEMKDTLEILAEEGVAA